MINDNKMADFVLQVCKCIDHENSPPTRKLPSYVLLLIVGMAMNWF